MELIVHIASCSRAIDGLETYATNPKKRDIGFSDS